MGKLLFGPRKHFLPHFLSITVRSLELGDSLLQPFHGTDFFDRHRLVTRSLTFPTAHGFRDFLRDFETLRDFLLIDFFT